MKKGETLEMTKELEDIFEAFGEQTEKEATEPLYHYFHTYLCVGGGEYVKINNSRSKENDRIRYKR